MNNENNAAPAAGVPTDREVMQQAHDVLLSCANRFAAYAGHHGEKGDYTKASVNLAAARLATESAEALRTALAAPVVGVLTDDQIEAAFCDAGGEWTGDGWFIRDADLHPFARAVLAAASKENKK